MQFSSIEITNYQKGKKVAISSTNLNIISFYSALLKLRPAQFSALIKKLLQVKRQWVLTLRGQKFWIDPVSVFGIELLREGVYESQMTQILELLLKPGDVFVDVGGNEGYFSVIASSLVQHGKVHCIEPQSRLQQIIQENIRLNSAHSIITHPIALSDQKGEVTLFLRPSTNTGSSSFFRYWKIGYTQEIVPTTTLDIFFKENSIKQVRLVKVDCEGAEYLAIAGGHNILREKYIDFLAIEYHPLICGVKRCLEIHQKLKDFGYVLTKIHGQCLYHLPGLDKELEPLSSLQIDCDWHE
ncbi:MAG: FkbM family methyltransferase [Goleter apudmare HA4340-LM2]|nr:FkbM family methyltransferase [Goleter apudmare HA4340-LM2]